MLVLIENIPTYQPIYGNTNLDRLEVNDIERIEVLKGPASVLYGSNAYVGVINIILRKNTSGNGSVRLSNGYKRFSATGANVTISKPNFNLFISGNTGSEMQKPYELLGKRGSTELFNGDSIMYFEKEIKWTNFNILANYKYVSFLLNQYEYEHTHLGINPSFISGGGKPMIEYGTLAALTFNKDLSEKINLKIDFAFDKYKRNWASNSTGSNALSLHGNRLFTNIKLNTSITEKLDFEAGIGAEQRIPGRHVAIDVLKDTVLRVNMKGEQSIEEISAFSQVKLKTRLVNILGGVRYTYNSFSGSNLSSRISAVSPINESNSVKLIYGQSFRAPTMLELFFDHPTVVGNINLKPETANSIELAYIYGKKHVFIQALAYYNMLEQLIVRYTPASGPPSEYRNVSSMNSYGIEFESQYQNPKIITIFFNYNYMKGIGTKAAENFKHVPEHTIKIGANKQIKDFYLSANCYGVSSVMGNPKLQIPIKAQFMLDAHAGYTHTISANKIILKHNLSAKNITGSKMLIPEYIRQTDNINSMATTAFGTRIIYTLTISF